MCFILWNALLFISKWTKMLRRDPVSFNPLRNFAHASAVDDCRQTKLAIRPAASSDWLNTSIERPNQIRCETFWNEFQTSSSRVSSRVSSYSNFYSTKFFCDKIYRLICRTILAGRLYQLDECRPNTDQLTNPNHILIPNPNSESFHRV